MSKKYLIFGQARSGTTSLSCCLNYEGYNGTRLIHEPTCIKTGERHLVEPYTQKLNFATSFPDNYSCPPEEFPHPQFHNPWDLSLKDKKKCYSFLDLLYSKYDGIKHIWGNNCYQSNFNIIDYVLENDVSLIFLYRRNQFDHYKSIHVTNSAGIFQMTDDGLRKEAVEKTRGRLNSIDEFPNIPLDHALAHVERVVKSLKIFWEKIKIYNNAYHLTYEDFYNSKNIEIEFKKIWNFLKLDSTKMNHDLFEKVMGNKNVKLVNEEVSSKIPNIEDYNNLYKQYPDFADFHLK